jgi:hypothetical protein
MFGQLLPNKNKITTVFQGESGRPRFRQLNTAHDLGPLWHSSDRLRLLLDVHCSSTVARSRFSLSSPLLSLTNQEPEKLVFWAPPAPAPARYSAATGEEPEPAGARPNGLLLCTLIPRWVSRVADQLMPWLST